MVQERTTIAAKAASARAALWAELGGPLLALGTVGVIEALARAPFKIPNPPAILLLVVVFSAFTGGLRPGLISAAIAWTYFAWFFSIPGQPFHYSDENLRRVLVWALTTPAIVVMVGLLKSRAEQAFRRIAERTAQLELANTELEAFSYSVSHDLRAPLRSIDGFSLALLEDCADKLEADGKKYLQNVRQSAQQMARLIDDLLALSRVTRTELRRERMDLTALARAVLSRLQRNEPERKVDVVVSDALMADGDPQLLSVALENLIGNAWKFTGKRSAARIELGAQMNGGRRAYFVRDNGAGFDMAYSDKLFGVFQRLHSATEFEGTGVGLATVQRIVRRHGGRIWAEGEVGRGATFFFTLDEEAR
jgi:signal transduction histidine kinase